MHGFMLTEMVFSLTNVRSEVTVYDFQTKKKGFDFPLQILVWNFG